jgi:hypothetical protein
VAGVAGRNRGDRETVLRWLGSVVLVRRSAARCGVESAWLGDEMAGFSRKHRREGQARVSRALACRNHGRQRSLTPAIAKVRNTTEPRKAQGPSLALTPMVPIGRGNMR